MTDVHWNFMCKKEYFPVYTWDGGYAPVTRGRIPSDTETSTPASGCPLWCPVLNPLSSSAVFTWMMFGVRSAT